MGIQALKSHADDKKHKEVVAAVSVFFKNSNNSQSTSSESSQRNASSSTQQQTPELTVNKSQVSIAEIRWALQTVTKGHFKNSNGNITELFKVMFPDSQITKMFTFGAHKTRYTINHGIAPYFHEILKANVNLADFYVISLDESMNSNAQANQMDCVIRYWDSEANVVKVQFWNSSYLGHRIHKDVLEKFKNSLAGLNPSKMIQVSMDGPSVSLKFLESLLI